MRVFSVADITLTIMKSDPPQLSIIARGLATSTGWRNAELRPLEEELSPDGILDVEFVADPPDGIALTVMTSIVADTIWADDVDRLIGVRVVARTNEKTELVSSPADLTTLALGEESDFDFTTLALGEEGDILTAPQFEKWPMGETNPFADIHKPVIREKQPFGEDFNRIDALVRRRDPFGGR